MFSNHVHSLPKPRVDKFPCGGNRLACIVKPLKPGAFLYSAAHTLKTSLVAFSPKLYGQRKPRYFYFGVLM